MNALIGGHIDLAFDNITLAWPQAKAGTVRALAVTSTAAQRDGAGGAAGRRHPARLRCHLLARRVRAGRHAAADRRSARRRGEAHPGAPEVRKNLSEVGAVPSPMTPDEFVEFITAERRKWQDVVRAAGVEQQ